MPRSLRWALGLQLVLGAVALASPSEAIRALAGAPAVLILPGWGFARARAGDLPGRILAALAWSAPPAALGWLLAMGLPATPPGRWGAAAVLGIGVLAALAGARLPTRRPEPSSPQIRLGMAAIGAALLATAWTERFTICRPLDGYWWSEAADAGWEPPSADVTAGDGWATDQAVGDPEAGVRVLRPATTSPVLTAPPEGTLLLVLRAPVGARIGVEAEGTATVEASPTVDPAEGPVDRYLTAGVAALRVDLAGRPEAALRLHLSDPAASTIYLLPRPESVWELDATGLLRYAHYYQLLNMVEQLHWARELGRTRWVTDVQPPLWTWMQAPVLLVTRGELPTQNVVLLVMLGALGAATLRAMDRWCPHAPLLAWLLPGLALAEHAKLLYTPGSAGLPDTLYTLTAVAGLGALARPGDAGIYVRAGLLSQLARYPGTLLVGLGACMDGRPRLAARLMAVVGGGMAAVGLGGLASGSLTGWLTTAAWETIPEHWHGDADPAHLVARIPSFYAAWLGYAGGTPILAALGWSRGTRVWLGTALAYSLLLCTIDHQPSHYFLPLLHLSVVALACTAASHASARVRTALLAAGLAGLWISVEWMPVVG